MLGGWIIQARRLEYSGLEAGVFRLGSWSIQAKRL
jgi:hypothetical protein